MPLISDVINENLRRRKFAHTNEKIMVKSSTGEKTTLDDDFSFKRLLLSLLITFLGMLCKEQGKEQAANYLLSVHALQ